VVVTYRSEMANVGRLCYVNNLNNNSNANGNNNINNSNGRLVGIVKLRELGLPFFLKHPYPYLCQLERTEQNP
jgi:hypothetical protein